VNADNVWVNAKVDYTLLDRWRLGHTWHSGTRLDRSPASSRPDESHGNEPSLRDEHDPASPRVVHMPLAD
jgi:hypothetical protein